MSKTRVDRRISVYECGANLKHMPNDSCTYEEAWAYVNEDLIAKWVNKCKGIQMLQGKAAMKPRDRSCSMGPQVTIQAVCGVGTAKAAAMALVEGWRHYLKAA